MTKEPKREMGNNQKVFRKKAQARQGVWERMAAEKIARFPFPPHGRIPNFAGAKEAAGRLFHIPVFRNARRIKVNPDAPQRYVRELALRRGITVFIPTPRLRGGFRRFDPARIPEDKIAEAASLSKGTRWSEEVGLEELPRLDAIVTGSVAVTHQGHRCGKGEGYSDIEYGILRELGQPPIPVATTVHDLQVAEYFPRDATDLPLSYVVTPTEICKIRPALSSPKGIMWDRLSEEQLEAMPILRELRGLAVQTKQISRRRKG